MFWSSGSLSLRVLVDGGLLAAGGVEGPAVEPAHVERALGAVEVAADAVLLGLVAGELAVFPRGRRSSRTRTWRPGSRARRCLSALDVPAAGGVDASWGTSRRSTRASGRASGCPSRRAGRWRSRGSWRKPLGWIFGLNGRSGAGPHHMSQFSPCGGSSFGRRLARRRRRSGRTRGPCRSCPPCPLLRNCMPDTLCGDTRRCVPTCTTRSASRAAFTIARPSRIVWLIGFSTYTCAPALHRRDRHQRVPVVRRGVDHDLRLLLLEQLAVVLVPLRLVARPLLHFAPRTCRAGCGRRRTARRRGSASTRRPRGGCSFPTSRSRRGRRCSSRPSGPPRPGRCGSAARTPSASPAAADDLMKVRRFMGASLAARPGGRNAPRSSPGIRKPPYSNGSI